MTEEDIVVSSRDGIHFIRLNRPLQCNALTVKAMGIMQRAIETATDDRSARVIVIGATGDKSFCAGEELSPGETPFKKPNFAENTLPFANLLRAGKASQLPIIAAVNGACVAGGMGLIGISDMTIASNTARFGMPGAKIGIFPVQLVAVLRDLIRPRLMAELCYTGRLISADEALSAGIVNRIVEPEKLDETVRELAENVAAVSPVAVRRGKYALRVMQSMSFEEMIAFAETQVGVMIMTEDACEGMTAFNEKRKPNWPNA